MAPCLGPLPLPLPLPLASPPLARCLFSLASSAQHTHPVQAPLLPPRRYMVAMGIKGYNNEGLSSQAWKNQSPQGGWQGFFAGSSNIIFTFGAHLLGLGWEGHLGSMGYCLLGTGHCYLWLEILICPPPSPAGGHAMLLEVMDSMFKPYRFHKVFYWRWDMRNQCNGCYSSVLCILRMDEEAPPAPSGGGSVKQTPLGHAPEQCTHPSCFCPPRPCSYSYVFTLVMPNSVFIYWGWPNQAAEYGACHGACVHSGGCLWAGAARWPSGLSPRLAPASTPNP